MTHIRSYTSVNKRAGWAQDFLRLFRGTAKSKANISEHVTRTIDAVRAAEQIVLRVTGRRLEGLKMLELGVGQLPRQMGVFGVKNDVIGIDLDVIPQGLDIRAYASMLRTNGAKRVLKTVARKAMGFDSSFLKELARQLGAARLPPLRIEQMDATRLSFPDNTFDFVYSFDVFEHFPEPSPVLKEVRRVLKPGGVSFTSLHPITTEDGFHDLRIIAGERDGIPHWAHLRAACREQVTASAYLNAIRVDEWRRIFAAEHPGATVELSKRTDEATLRSHLAEIRQGGDLTEYSDEELVCERLLATWQKPGGMT